MRICRASDRWTVALSMEVDASPWGGGAVLWHGPAGDRHQRQSAAFFAVEWTKEDEDLLHTVIGEPDGHARWEAFVCLLALRHWIREGVAGKIMIIGDAEGVIASFVKGSSRDPVINEMIMES